MLGKSLSALALAGVVYGKNVTVKTYGNSTTHWTACGELANRTLECATIHVPMDHWAKQSTNKTFSVPLMRMLVNDTAADTVLLNPGGPGGSGIDFLKGYGAALDKILDGRFHLLGFDPRGIGESRPLARCEPDNARIDNPVKNALGPLVPSWDSAQTVQANSGDFYAGYGNWAKLCNETLGEYLPYINTPQTAADMNDILFSIGQPKMSYYGTSYGTVLGATYAQLFPDRINRMAIDGVADYESWYAPAMYDEGTVDIDGCWEGFLSHCMDERSTCSLADGYTNVSALDTAIKHKLDSMDIDPIGVYINSSAYGILRGADIRGEGVFMRMYSSSRWPYLARSLEYILKGEYLTPYLHFYGGVSPKNPRASTKIPVGAAVTPDAVDGLQLVTINDKSPKNQQTRVKLDRKQLVASYKPYLGYMAQDVGIADDFMFETWLLPRSHDLVPASRIETAYPVLLMSNTLDPVTPLVAAKQLNKILKDSVLVVQNAIGHCTISKPSKCTAAHLRAYFVDGKLPQAGTLCQPDDPKYFPDPDLKVSKIQVHKSQHDFELEQALEKLAEHSEALSQGHARRSQHIV